MDHFPTLALSLGVSAITSGQPVPVLHWTLDESSGSVAHEMNGLSPGVLLGGVQWDPNGGHHLGACRFDGVDDRILLGACDITTGTGGMALSLWIKPDLVTGMERVILAKASGSQLQDHVWSLALVNATAVRFRLRTGGSTKELTTPPSSIFSGAWYHVIASYDGSSMRIYLNGALMAESAVTGSTGYHPQVVASLGALNTGVHPFSGWVDDVRIHDRGLTQNEVIDILLEEELTTFVPGLTPWGRMSGSMMPAERGGSSLQFLDASGRAVLSPFISAVGEMPDLSRIPAGFYLVCLQGEGWRRVYPMVIP